ncbi:MAG: class II aldolase/adducin family protein [Rubrivivax sp.]|nr:class II aldolase/adducin family protein [Rubrivivax sp.]
MDLATLYPSERPASIEPAEWSARLALAAAYRVFDLLGWTELIYNHISLRVPDSPGHFLINPFGLHYSEVCASNLLKVDLQGQIVGAANFPVNPAGVTPHATLHRHVERAHCVMHTHTTAGMAVACSEEGLLFTSFYAAQLVDDVAYHEFEGITVHADESQRLLASIGRRQLVILRNHGLLAWGETLPATFYRLWALQRACEIQIAGAALGPRREIPVDIQRRCAEDSRRVNMRPGFGQDVFEAMVRLADRRDDSWRR